MNNILSHFTSVHTHTPYNFKIPFNIIILSMSGVSLVPSLYTLQHKFVYASLISIINSFITSTFTTHWMIQWRRWDRPDVHNTQ